MCSILASSILALVLAGCGNISSLPGADMVATEAAAAQQTAVSAAGALMPTIEAAAAAAQGTVAALQPTRAAARATTLAAPAPPDDPQLRATVDAVLGRLPTDVQSLEATARAAAPTVQSGLAGARETAEALVALQRAPFPEDIPRPPDRQNEVRIANRLVFSVVQPLEDVVAFYNEAMPRNGWRETNDTLRVPRLARISYTQGDRRVDLSIASPREGTIVDITYTP